LVTESEIIVKDETKLVSRVSGAEKAVLYFDYLLIESSELAIDETVMRCNYNLLVITTTDYKYNTCTNIWVFQHQTNS